MLRTTSVSPLDRDKDEVLDQEQCGTHCSTFLGDGFVRKVISRPDLDLPDFPLPVHIRSVGYNEADPGWKEEAPGERKIFVQLFWCVEGVGEFVFGERIERIGAGEVMYHLPGEDHIHRSVDPRRRWCYYWVTFDGPGAAAFMKAYGYPQSPCSAGECPVRLFQEIEQLLKQRTPYAQRHAISVLTEILALAGERHSETRRNSMVGKFIEAAHKRFQEPEMTVGLLARELRIHRTTLNRLFQKEMRLSPGSYLEQIRIQKALSLLRETDLSIKEIAYSTGFSHVSYFCAVIRRKTGMTPEEYRLNAGMD